MKDSEQKIIRLIQSLETTKDHSHSRIIQSTIDDFFKKRMKGPFGSSSVDFLNDPILKFYVKKSYDHSFTFWMLIENYLVNANNQKLENESFELLSKELKKELNNDFVGYLAHQALTKPTLIRNVYLSANDKLIHLFMQLLPTPKSELFYGYKLPFFIAERELKATESILSNTLNEEIIIKAQRRIRSKIRHQEELKRISDIVATGRSKNYFKKQSGKKTVEQLLEDANTPYRPRGCDPALADRIMNAAAKVKLFSSIRHLTSARALPSILNDGLFGRRTLEKFNLPYKSAALMGCDVKDGDLNVICFGPQEIDPHSKQTDSVEITIHFDKIQKDNPCIFYKQRDFGFGLERAREVSLGNETLTFSHTNFLRCADPDRMNLQIYSSFGGLTAYSELPKFLFIAYDVQHIHQILTLNFFRFLDTLSDVNDNDASYVIKSYYRKIAALNDGALVNFLQDLGRNLTDTAEFNFYGAHKIDFSSIEAITFNHFKLHLPTLINELKAGHLDTLKKAKDKIPQLFKSYRLIDFLLSEISNTTIQSELQQYRKNCMLPFWLEAKENKISIDNLSMFQKQFIQKQIDKREEKDFKRIAKRS